MPEEIVIAGTVIPESGAYRCATCDYGLIVDGTEVMQPCPRCGGGRWLRTSSDGISPSGDNVD